MFSLPRLPHESFYPQFSLFNIVQRYWVNLCRLLFAAITKFTYSIYWFLVWYRLFIVECLVLMLRTFAVWWTKYVDCNALVRILKVLFELRGTVSFARWWPAKFEVDSCIMTHLVQSWRLSYFTWVRFLCTIVFGIRLILERLIDNGQLHIIHRVLKMM